MQIFVQQLVVPTYRVPFFNELNRRSDGRYTLELHASDHVPGFPSTSDQPIDCALHVHPCKCFFGKELYWQQAMKLPSDFARGDVVIFNSNLRILSNFRLVAQAKSRGLAVVSWNHHLSSSSKPILSSIRQKMVASVTDHFLVYTESEREVMLQDGYRDDQVTALNNTIDSGPIYREVKKWCDTIDEGQANFVSKARSSEKIRKFRTEICNDDQKLLLYCGRILSRSRLDILVKSVAILNQQKKRFALVVIGDGPDRSTVEKLASDFGQEANIKWLGKIYDESLLAPWFLAADFLVYPGPIGLSLNHAMTYGLPVITHENSKSHGPEFAYLRAGYNGLLFKQNCENDLSETIERAVKNSNASLSKHSIETSTNTFSLSKMVSQFSTAVLGISKRKNNRSDTSNQSETVS